MTRGPDDHVNELISASLDGDLTELERGELNEHLSTCAACRQTLTAFTEERRLVSGLRPLSAPRDLDARVRAGIASGQLQTAPWWRRSGSIFVVVTSVAAIATLALSAVIFLINLPPGPVGQTASPGPSTSGSPTPSSSATAAPSATPPGIAFLGRGELGYLSLNGASFEALRLTFVNDATGASVDAGTVSGPPIAAALSPDGRWLAYITEKGESGANETWALDLSDGTAVSLGCSQASPFADRLAWSPDGRYLAYTLVGIDLGPSSGCQPSTGGTDVWLFDTTVGAPTRFTTAGYAFAAAFAPDSGADSPRLWVSFAIAEPQSALLGIVPDATRDEQTFDQQPGVFLPLFSPDGNRALFWRGTLTSDGGAWRFSRGGMPQLSGDFRSSGPASPWLGTPLFTDLTPVGGEAFAQGSFTWGMGSDLVAFWNGAWTGAPQSADGSYPSQRDIYVGRMSTGLLGVGSRVALVPGDEERFVDVTFSPDGSEVVVSIGQASLGIGDPPSALLEVVPLGGGPTRQIGNGGSPLPWNGPAVFGP